MAVLRPSPPGAGPAPGLLAGPVRGGGDGQPLRLEALVALDLPVTGTEVPERMTAAATPPSTASIAVH